MFRPRHISHIAMRMLRLLNRRRDIASGEVLIVVVLVVDGK